MENASLTLADMASLKNLIEAATARGAFRANEMSTVGLASLRQSRNVYNGRIDTGIFT